MRALPIVAALLAAGLFGTGAARGAERSWVVQAGGGAVYLPEGTGFQRGNNVHVSVARVVRPAILVGGDATWTTLTPLGVLAIPFLQRVTENDTKIASLSAFVRLQKPVAAGPSPFVDLEAGVARMHAGDLHYDATLFGDERSLVPGETRWASRMAAGLGLRAVIPGGWPDVEVSARAVTYGLNPRLDLTEVRGTLTY